MLAQRLNFLARIILAVAILVPLIMADPSPSDLEAREAEEEAVLAKRDPLMENLRKRDVPPGYSSAFTNMNRVPSATANLLVTSTRYARFNNTACAQVCSSTANCQFFIIYTTDAPYAGVYCKHYSVAIKKSDLDAKTVSVHGTDAITLHGAYGYANLNPQSSTDGSTTPNPSDGSTAANAAGIVSKLAMKETNNRSFNAGHKHKRHGHE